VIRKILLVVLILIAVPVYVYDSYLVWRFVVDRRADHATGNEAEAVSVEALSNYPSAKYEKKGRSPFLAYAQKPKPKPKPTPRRKPVRRAAKPKKTVTAPNITITGIMWNESNPMAMLTLPGGSSTAARAGQTLSGGITVVKIERNRIQVEYEGNRFWIER
jgi:hypothetical protein